MGWQDAVSGVVLDTYSGLHESKMITQSDQQGQNYKTFGKKNKFE